MTFSLHPLFFVFGLYFAACGKVFSFLTYTFCAVIHETGHAIAAQKLGYRLKRVTLMPYGAVISGDIDGIGLSDELKVVAAGPLVNLITGLCIVAAWWVFPEVYPYTELAATANFSLFLINLLPAYPLDGGRCLLCLLSKKLSRKTAVRAVKTLGVILFALLAGLFIYSCFTAVNFSTLFFATFILFGVLDNNADDRYVRFIEGLSSVYLKNGRTVKTVAVSENITVRKLYALMDGGSLYKLEVYSDDGKLVEKIEADELIERLKVKRLSDKIK